MWGAITQELTIAAEGNTLDLLMAMRSAGVTLHTFDAICGNVQSLRAGMNACSMRSQRRTDVRRLGAVN